MLYHCFMLPIDRGVDRSELKLPTGVWVFEAMPHSGLSKPRCQQRCGTVLDVSPELLLDNQTHGSTFGWPNMCIIEDNTLQARRRS